MEQELKLSIISNGVLYVYEGRECKECAFREDCKDTSICESLGVSGSFAENGRVNEIKVETNVID